MSLFHVLLIENSFAFLLDVENYFANNVWEVSNHHAHEDCSMPRPPSSQPTDVELQILQILWEHGPSTVRQVHDHLLATKETNYSTTVKMLGIMLKKELVSRDDTVRPQVYRAAKTRKSTQRRMLDDLILKLYDGSATSLIQQALSSKHASKEEIAEIRRLLKRKGGQS